MTSIDYETAAALHEESTNDSHLGEMPKPKPNHTIKIKEIAMPLTTKHVIQDHYKSLNQISFYQTRIIADDYLTDVMITSSTVCAWHVKSKSTLPESVEATVGEKNMGI